VLIAAFGTCLGLTGLSFTHETKNSSLERIDDGSVHAH
jgi:hypothetical protein